MIPTIRFYSIAHQKLSQYRNGIHDLLLPVPLQVTDMAKHLLEKQPEVLFGGDSLASGEKRCQDFWQKFRSYQPTHVVYQHHAQELSKVIPICIHGDKGRTLKKSPIACYSWESVWGLPAELRDISEHVKRQSQTKHDTGRLGQPCCDRPAWNEDDSETCTIKRRRLGEHVEDTVQTHNSLGDWAHIFAANGYFNGSFTTFFIHHWV